MSALRDRLAELRTVAYEASAEYVRRRDAAPSARIAVSEEVTRPLREFQARHNPLRRTSEHVEEERKLTADALKEVKKRGLIFIIQTTSQGLGFAVDDPDISSGLADALEVKNKADAELRSFEQDNADALKAEERDAEGAAFREAVDSNDLETARRLLNGDDAEAALTTTPDPKNARWGGAGEATQRHRRVMSDADRTQDGEARR